MTIDEQAEAHLRAMSSYLEKLEKFSFSARQVFADQVVDMELLVQRPNKLRAETAGDRGRQTVVYDGTTLKIAFHEDKAWAAVEAPDTVDAMVDHLVEDYDMPLHLADLLAASPYDSLVVAGTTGSYAGMEEGAEGDCHRLEFTNEAVDWQVCILAAGEPLPLHFSITYKGRPGTPQRSTSFTQWNVEPETPDGTFVFAVPEGFEKIPFVKTARGDQS